MATVLTRGTVLVVGGFTRFPTATATAELYDPATGAFTTTGSMGTARAWAYVTRLASGQVLVAGGSTGRAALASAEVFDLATGRFTATGPLAAPRAVGQFLELEAPLLGDGSVLVAGGGDRTATASAERYDPATGTWSRTGSMATARSGITLRRLPDGRVLAVGGDPPLTVAEVYTP